MGFPVSFKDFSFSKFMHSTLSFLGLMKELLYVMFFYQPCVEAFLDPDISWPTRLKTRHDKSTLLAVLIREVLPVVKYSELVSPPESCAVCLHEFSDSDEIRKLMNCQHVFHRKCVDRWMDHEQKTCPLCRMPFISDEMEEACNRKLGTAS